MEWQVPGEKAADGSIHRPELKLFELKNGVQIPNLREAWAHPAKSAPGLECACPCATVGFVGSGAGCGRSRSNLSRDSRPKWRFCCKIGAPARSPYPLAPTHQPLQCAAPQTRTRVVLLPSPLVASAWRCIEALRLSSGGTALNKNSSRSHAVLTIKVRRGGPYIATCNSQDTTRQ